MEARVRRTTAMPQLTKDPSPGSVDCGHEGPPSFDHRWFVDARVSIPAVCLFGDRDAFCDEQAGRCPLHVVLGIECVRLSARSGAAAGHRGEDNPVGERELVVQRQRIEQSESCGHASVPLSRDVWGGIDFACA